MSKTFRSLRNHLFVSSLLILALLLICACTVAVHENKPDQPIAEVQRKDNATDYKTKHVFIVVMDGVRYSETFGDKTHKFIPHLYNDLQPQGTLFTHCYNRGITVTRQGHSTLISGTWQRVPNGGARLTRPTLFEYYRDEKKVPPAKCWSVFGKALYAFEPYSSHPAYGNRYAGQHINGGGPENPLHENSPEGDAGVLKKVIEVMKRDQPDILFINFGYTDHIGHVAKDISEYQAAVKHCDEQMWRLWNEIQADPHYRNTTTAFFTNDHGRHTHDFHEHGDHCEGCEHTMLLALGPDIKEGVVVDKEVLQIDVAPTVAELLDLQTPLARGKVITECLTRYQELNKMDARTESARRAVEIEKLADRNLVQAAADYVLSRMKPETVPANLNGELLAGGLLRAYRETKDHRYLDFVERWIDIHRGSVTGETSVSLGKIILELPPEVRQEHIALARQIGDQTVTGRFDLSDRGLVLKLSVFLGLLSEITKNRLYADSGLKLLKAALGQSGPKPFVDREASQEFILLGQAAATFRDDGDVLRNFVLAAGQRLRNMKENGALWDDPIVSVMNLYAIEASMRGRVLREFVQIKDPKAVLPSCVKTMTIEELRPLFPDRPWAQLPQLQAQLVNLIFERGKQNLPFSLDMLRYGVSESGGYADGSEEAQGGFLLSYWKSDWRYGGNTWPGRESGGN
jgi:hypothetical protein